MRKNLLSVVISVFNGEKELEDCLKSASFADEIIVVNNSSTDKTEEIARRYTDKIFTRPNNPMLNVNKNFGFSKARGE
jgi:glycosyltransferase involved in cell wall biosynthesis